jgi:hypothetical protein
LLSPLDRASGGWPFIVTAQFDSINSNVEKELNCMALPTSQLRLHGAHHPRAIRLFMVRCCLSALVMLAGSLVAGCGSGDEGSPGNPLASAAASKSLAWDPVNGVHGYVVYYGSESPGAAGSCAYAESVFTTTPSVTVTGLNPNTTYYFAVSAFNGLESPCSTELMTVMDAV